jgi:(1->4)-alpha-D-glucan 1-alpha-D-glucosylmutase
MSNAPISTYRLQIRAEFGFDDVVEVSSYLDRLGVSHAYLSPILQAAPGSAHGYDVVDHGRLSADAGGMPAFQRMIAALRRHGLLAIADIVPNHMAVPTPLHLNAALWAVLRDGPDSEFARWFDVDWSVPANAVLMPVLGNRIGQVVKDGELSVDRSGPEPVLRYFDHVFPIRRGTDELALPDLLARQWYRLAWWRVADDELNYRRFFDVDTLAAVRVEDPVVFDATHVLIEQLVLDGSLTGLRIDHPDGLADPRAYLRQLAAATDGIWVSVEKILEGDEELPSDWACAGTTGYDALNRIGGLFIDPAGAAPLSTVLDHFTGGAPTVDEVVEDAKRLVIEHILTTEVRRLVDLLQAICRADLDLRDHTRRALRESVTELLVAMDRYRAYVVPGEQAPEEARTTLARATAIAREQVAEESQDTLDLVAELILDGPGAGKDPRRAEFVVRFQQACGPVMAKGVEDTTFYRWHRLISLNEVGAEPGLFGVTPEDFHAFASRLARDWPATMTTLSTHDTKRSEDARAQLVGLAELPLEWANALRHWHELGAHHRSPDGWPDPETEYLFWQTVVATWSPGAVSAGSGYTHRITEYLSKATREAKEHTSWTSPDLEYDSAIEHYATATLADPAVLEAVGAFCATLAGPTRVAVLGQKLVQLTMPGVADVYQGTEIVDLSLVDPDNRRPVDYGRRSRLLTLLDDERPVADTLAAMPAGDRLDAEKLLVTSRVLRLRREHPDWFVGGTYVPVATSAGNAIAFGRGPLASQEARPASQEDPPASQGVETAPIRVITVATRLPVALARHGGWAEHTVSLPDGTWTDLFTGRQVSGRSSRLADLLVELPVALLVRE